MRRFLIFAGFAVGMSLAMRKTIAEAAGPVVRERCSKMCDRFLAGMPRSFPPNRIMADLDTLKMQTARILEVLEQREKLPGRQPRGRRPKKTATDQE